jgi:hypothetical protein
MVEETGVPVASHWQTLSYNVVLRMGGGFVTKLNSVGMVGSIEFSSV